ncbi:HEAT repeat domain-containing protein [Euzebya rosea]|uniref:HEAT repeat domain-containing protein n=1 Tax=Euzebya rosea TaxID=2052804 RepID=UPI0013005004|nr:HEAT repeat domain-containing protein [Euzebya rosea]
MDTQHLTAAMQGRSPLVDSWRPGRGRDELTAARLHGHPLPEPVVEWFAWHDGTASDHELLVGGRPLPLDRALTVARARWDTAESVARDIGMAQPIGWDEGWLPVIASHQEETCWVVDCRLPDPPVLRVDAEDPDPATAFGSLADMVAELGTAWASGALVAEDDGRARRVDGAPLAGPLTAADVELLDSLASDDEDTTWEATEAIASRLSPDFLAGLGRAVQSAPLEWTRTRAIELIAQVGGPDAQRRLVDILAHGDQPALRETAAGFLDPYDAPVVADALVAALDDPAPAVRARAAYSLAGMTTSITADHLSALDAHRSAADPATAAAIEYTLGLLRR